MFANVLLLKVTIKYTLNIIHTQRERECIDIYKYIYIYMNYAKRKSLNVFMLE